MGAMIFQKKDRLGQTFDQYTFIDNYDIEVLFWKSGFGQHKILKPIVVDAYKNMELGQTGISIPSMIIGTSLLGKRV